MILFQRNTKKDRQGEADTVHGLISEMCKSGLLDGLVEDYIGFCHRTHTPAAEDASKARTKSRTLFPNLAGFCRWLGWGGNEMELLKKTTPDLYDRICTVLEDEALNSDLSASVLTAYLKQRIWRAEPSSDKSTVDQGDQLRLIFEHDILEDGS